MKKDSKSRALSLFAAEGRMLRTSEVLALGIPRTTLYALRDEGTLEQVCRGVYRLASLPPLAHPDLVAVALRVPAATICLSSALELHEVTTQVPHEVQIALPRGTKTPRLDHPPIRVFRFSGPALTSGVETIELDDTPIRVYSLVKTVVDCFRLRNRIGLDVALEALRLSMSERGVRPAEILAMARECGIATVVTPYVEALA